MLNRIIIMGRLCADPELKRTSGGVAVTTFSVACNREFKDKSTGEKGTDFFEAVAWRNNAEFICKHFTKGRAVVLEGRMQNREWTDKDGNRRKTAEIHVDSVYFADSKPESKEAPAPYGGFADIPEDPFDPFA